MTPLHTRFNVLFRNHRVYHSRSLNGDEPRHPSLKTIPEDGPVSLDRPRDINVDERGLQLLYEPEINCIGCTLSDSDHFSNEQASPITAASFVERRMSEPSEAGNFADGAPRLSAEAHISQRQADTSYTQSCVMLDSFCEPDVPEYSSTGFLFPPTTISSTYPQLIPAVTTSTSLAYSTHQSSKSSYSTSVDNTSSGSAISHASSGSSSSIHTPSQSTNPYAGSPTLSSSSGDPSSGDNTAVGTTTYTTVASTYQTIGATITVLQPLSSTVTSTRIDMVSSSLSQPSSVLPTTSNTQPSPTIGAIIGGTVGAVVLLSLLTFILLRRRRITQLSITPFNLLSTAGPTQVESRTWFKFQSASGAVRPNSGGSSFIQYSDSGNRSLSFATDRISSHLADEEIFASSVARLYRSHGLEKLYPYQSHVSPSDHHDAESRIEHIVTDGYSQRPSEEPPAYPRSVDSFGSRKADLDDPHVLTGS
ncbi:uncharacterized protein F5147DRAFT_239092 [Suillus discolor]|uniref:Uncharacterized protein n=1 Tax=Suillus discolor TaxID=1912936 RepID=A0A9P7JSE3_9AGAM|nr:uncharacterized protein F5147DRAFT_239092 [Suillus discolor]KAG2105857.1 hypothetical protein F5147DRAFT_239092 [Suillus discolor]